MSSVTNSRFRSYEIDKCKLSNHWTKAYVAYLQEELLGTDGESLLTGSLEVLNKKIRSSARSYAEFIIAYLFLTNIGHECVNFISLLDQPSKNARSV